VHGSSYAARELRQGTPSLRAASPVTLTVDRTGTGSGRIQGTMAFDRKDYGMDSNNPFIRIAHRAEVDVDLTATRIGGPTVVFKY